MATNSYATQDYKANIKIPNVDMTLDALLKKVSTPDVNKRIPLQVGIYGGKGTGKTIAAIKLALAAIKDDERILYIDSAENWSSIINHPEIDPKRILRYPYQRVESLHSWVREMKNNPQHPIIKAIGAVILDEYSSMVQEDLTWITQARASELAKQGDDSKDPYTPAWPDYRSVEVRFLRIIQGFMNAKPELSLVFISHEKYYEKENKTRAEMPSATAADYEKLLHGLYRVAIEEKKVRTESGTKVIRSRTFQTMPTKTVSAKTRIGGLPDYATLEQLIEGYKNWGRKDLEKVTENTTEKNNNKEN